MLPGTGDTHNTHTGCMQNPSKHQTLIPINIIPECSIEHINPNKPGAYISPLTDMHINPDTRTGTLHTHTYTHTHTHTHTHAHTHAHVFVSVPLFV
jgi:hypothetical protein